LLQRVWIVNSTDANRTSDPALKGETAWLYAAPRFA
jgi:hypothetical protein